MMQIKCAERFNNTISATLTSMLETIGAVNIKGLGEIVNAYFSTSVMPYFVAEDDTFIGYYDSEEIFVENLPNLIRYAYYKDISKIALMIETGFAGKLSSEVSTNGSSTMENFSMNEDSPIDSLIDSINTPSEKNQHRGGTSSERKFHGNFDSRENIRYLLSIKSLQEIMVNCFKKIVEEYVYVM